MLINVCVCLNCLFMVSAAMPLRVPPELALTLREKPDARGQLRGLGVEGLGFRV